MQVEQSVGNYWLTDVSGFSIQRIALQEVFVFKFLFLINVLPAKLDGV